MSTKFDARMYEENAMDKEIDNDVAELRTLLSDVPDMEEPHPAYWNNFLLRVHERIEQEAAPKKKPWWSPALIWGSLTGAAAALVVAWSVGIFPFGSGGDDPVVIASNDIPPQQEELVLTPRPLDEDLSMPMTTEDAAEEASYSIVLTQEDIDMINAIQSDDDGAILMEIIDDPDMEI